MNTLNYIVQKYDIDLRQRSPIEIPNIGRDLLAGLFNELGFTVGVEIGVQQGEYAEVLCKAIPGLKLYGVDPWKTYRGYREYVTQAKLDGFIAEACDRLTTYDWQPIRRFSMAAAEDFDANSIDFVYIDGNHDLQNVINDIAEWSKKVRPGGIISGHDYIKRKGPTNTHVISAVQAYTYSYGINPWFLLGARKREPGIVRDRSRSWMWVKE